MRSGLGVIALVSVLSACTATGGVFGSRRSPDGAARAAQSSRVEAEGLGVYLDMMRRLIEGDTVDQAETFRRVQQDAESSPTTTNRLKLALALAVPNQPSANPRQAAERLRALLAERGALLPQERVLATIELNDVEQRLVLDRTAQQLKQDADAQQAKESSEQAQRLKAALEENRKLKAQLHDALSKLDAITTIEQSIRKRENAPN